MNCRPCILFSLVAILGVQANTCVSITEHTKSALCRYVQRKYGLPDDSRVVISDVSTIGGSCYRKLRFVATAKRRFDVNLILTPDQKFLVPELNDLALDPVVEEDRRRAAMRIDLERSDSGPSLGPMDAPVTFVVFSDFQCPYCKKFAETLRQVASEERRARFVFRNMPLAMHPWAMPAAELAACVQMQNGEAFWRIHDYLFDHQRELSADNLRPKVMGFIRTLQSVQAEQVGECVDKHLSRPSIQRDLALATANKVEGTPTVFVNGLAANGALTREHLLTLINESSSETPAHRVLR